MKDLVLEVNRRLGEYLEVLRSNWFPPHGHARFDRAVCRAVGDKEMIRHIPYNLNAVYRQIGELIPIHGHFIDLWEHDIEHGIFHGLMVGFIVYLLDLKLVPTLMPDFLLHDFLKCAGVPQESHDSALESYFLLDPVTYRHSRPSDNDKDHPLIIADRVELMRYPDHRSWVDFSRVNRNKLPWDLVEAHYRCVRPHLEKLFRDRCGIWVRHFDERGVFPELKIIARDGCYPEEAWEPPHPDRQGFFSVEIGTLYGLYGLANRLTWPVYSEMMTQGFLPLEYIKKTRSPLMLCKDHYTTSVRAPHKEWVFMDVPPYDTWDLGMVSKPVAFGLLSLADHLATIIRANREF